MECSEDVLISIIVPVYNYDETKEKIESFLGKEMLGKQSKRFQAFDPRISIKNTQNWNIHGEWAEEIRPIEEKMGKYLYDFPYKICPNEDEVSNPY